MIPDRLQYFLDDFWNCENLVKIWTLGARIYYQNASKHIRKIWEHIFSQLIGVTKRVDMYGIERLEDRYRMSFWACSGLFNQMGQNRVLDIAGG